MVPLPGFDVGDLEQVVRVPCALGGLVDHDGRRDQLLGRHLRNIETVLAGDPVHGRIEVSADVLTCRDVVPVPGRAALVIAADLLQREMLRVHKWRRQLDHRRVLRERRGEVDDLDGPSRDTAQEVAQDGHCRLKVARLPGQIAPLDGLVAQAASWAASMVAAGSDGGVAKAA